jgi:hypothetical protein
METIGGRLFAGTSCLLACAFNNETRDGSTNSETATDIRQCEQRCNDDFMSMKSVDVSSTYIKLLINLRLKSFNDGKYLKDGINGCCLLLSKFHD